MAKIRTRDIQRSNNLARITVTFEMRMSIIVNPLLSQVVSSLLTEGETTVKTQDINDVKNEAEYMNFAKQAGLQKKIQYSKTTKTFNEELSKHGTNTSGITVAAIARSAIEMEPTIDKIIPNRRKAIVIVE